MNTHQLDTFGDVFVLLYIEVGGWCVINGKAVAVFLQSYDPSAFNFLTMLGFKQMNDHHKQLCL